jgi:hypothetical protein
MLSERLYGSVQEREAMDRYFVITFSDHPKLRADSRQSIETGEAALVWQNTGSE